MEKIIGILYPFDKKQNFYVYENGNKLASTQLTLEEIPEQILNWSKEYNIKNVELIGPKQYNRGLKRRILEAEIAKYNTNSLNISLARR